MSHFDARTHDFEEISLFDKPALFTCLRIDRSTVPRGYHQYEIRESEGFSVECCQIGKRIVVNHWGTVIANERIKLDKDGFRDMTDEDINYGVVDRMTLREFMDKHPPVMEISDKER